MYDSHYLAQYALAVAVTFGLLALAGWLASRYGQKIRNLPRGKSSSDFETLGRISLGGQHQLHHVRWKNTDLLIATHPHGTTLISSSATKKPK